MGEGRKHLGKIYLNLSALQIQNEYTIFEYMIFIPNCLVNRLRNKS